MRIGDIYINEKMVAIAEPYVQDRDYGLKINGVPLELGVSDHIFSPEEKVEKRRELTKTFIEKIQAYKLK